MSRTTKVRITTWQAQKTRPAPMAAQKSRDRPNSKNSSSSQPLPSAVTFVPSGQSLQVPLVPSQNCLSAQDWALETPLLFVAPGEGALDTPLLFVAPGAGALDTPLLLWPSPPW